MTGDREMTKTPRYDEWQHLRMHGSWSQGIPDWARDYEGRMSDMTAATAVIKELAGALASSSSASVSASKCKSHGLLSCAECDPARVSEPDNDWYNPNREAYQACFVSPDNSQAVAQWKCNACISTFTKYESLGESGKPNCPKGVALSEHRINELETTLSLADERFVNAITRLKELESQAVALSAEQERYKVALEAIVANDPFKQSSAGAIARAALSAPVAPPAQSIADTVGAKDRARWLVADFRRETGFAMSDRQDEILLNLFLKYASPAIDAAGASEESALYTMDQMRDYADVFHLSRMKILVAEKEAYERGNLSDVQQAERNAYERALSVTAQSMSTMQACDAIRALRNKIDAAIAKENGDE